MVRAAVLATHAASGYCQQLRARQPARLLRAAEGLARQALLLCSEQGPEEPPAAAPSGPSAGAKKKPRRRKKKLAKSAAVGEVMDVDAVAGRGTAPPALAAEVGQPLRPQPLPVEGSGAAGTLEQPGGSSSTSSPTKASGSQAAGTFSASSGSALPLAASTAEEVEDVLMLPGGSVVVGDLSELGVGTGGAGPGCAGAQGPGEPGLAEVHRRCAEAGPEAHALLSRVLALYSKYEKGKGKGSGKKKKG